MKYITVSKSLSELCQQKVLETIQKVQPYCKHKTIPVPTLRFRQLGRRAGIFSPIRGLVVINPDYFKNYHDDMLNDTVPHEVCHHISHFMFGSQLGGGHGAYWKKVMSWAGIPSADRCHEYSLEGVKVKNFHRDYKYSCQCSTPHMVTAVMHNKIQIQGQHRRCKRCHNRIVYEGFTSNGIFIPKRPNPIVEIITIKPADAKVARILNLPFVKPIVPPTPQIEPKFQVETVFENGVLVNRRVPLTA